MSLNTTPTHPLADSYVTLAEANAFLQDRTNVTDWSALTDQQKEALLKMATQHIDSLRFFDEPFLDDPKYYRDRQYLQFPRESAGRANGTVHAADGTSITDPGLANRNTIPTDYFKGGAVIITEGTGRGQTAKVSAFDATTGKITVDAAWTTTPDTTSQYVAIVAVPIRVKYAVIEQALYLIKGGGERSRMQAEGVTAYRIGDLSETFGGKSGQAGTVPISTEARGYLKGYISRVGVLT